MFVLIDSYIVIDKLEGLEMKSRLTIPKYIFFISFFIVCLLIGSKYFSLTWVEMSEEEAKVTINFLVPMEQEAFNSRIFLESERSDSQDFKCLVKWLSPEVVQIRLKEQNVIKGLGVKIIIKDAPTTLKGITKSEKVNLQFHVPIEMQENQTKKLISSTESFTIHFNTPIHKRELEKYIKCEVPLTILPGKQCSKQGKEIADYTYFTLTPQSPLTNDQTYTLTIEPGLRSSSGHILMQSLQMYLQVDKKPTIIQTYPETGDKWIGLYPKITFTSKEPIIGAIAKINQQTLVATLIDEYHGYFLMNRLLLPLTPYNLLVQVKAASGELSLVKSIEFSTTSLDQNRSWLEIRCGEQKCIHYYEGKHKVKTLICGIGKQIKPIHYGTYYLLDKVEVYEDIKKQQGANYWMPFTENIGIHGATRSSSWEILDDSMQGIGSLAEGSCIILSDEDAKWLYDRIAPQTMIVIRK